jgi:hypothetical protein
MHSPPKFLPALPSYDADFDYLASSAQLPRSLKLSTCSHDIQAPPEPRRPQPSRTGRGTTVSGKNTCTVQQATSASLPKEASPRTVEVGGRCG